jgi:hypothetical protein
MMIWLTFIGSGMVMRYGGHIAVENLQDAFPRPVGQAIRVLVACLLMAFFVMMSWIGWQYTQRAMFQLTAATQSLRLHLHGHPGGRAAAVHPLPAGAAPLHHRPAIRQRCPVRRHGQRLHLTPPPHAMNPSLVLIIAACVYLAIGVPVAFALGLATATALLLTDSYPLLVLLKETFTGVDSFPLMAVPFFILAAELMSGGSLTEVLLRFAGQFVGHKRGGLGYTNVVSLTFFSGISGSALADAAGPGSMLIRMMDKAGYDKSYAAALTASTAIVGPIIPPSITMIVYALQDESVSVGALFVAGILPGS